MKTLFCLLIILSFPVMAGEPVTVEWLDCSLTCGNQKTRGYTPDVICFKTVQPGLRSDGVVVWRERE